MSGPTGNGQLDHLVIVAPSRGAGNAWVEDLLGVPLQDGGEHTFMGTHNALLRLGEDQYLEVIAVNPGAETPGRQRWFGLDEMPPEAGPRLATWVARVDALAAVPEGVRRQMGEIVPASRGSLSWLITIRPDGSMADNGITPMLIEWRSEQRPAQMLEDRGCTLVHLEGFHPDAGRIADLLQSVGLEHAVTVNPLAQWRPPYLVAHIKTPLGLRAIGGPA